MFNSHATCCMQQCCVQQSTYTVQHSCTQHSNIHDATKLQATVAGNSCIVYGGLNICVQQSCMQQGNIHGTTMLHATLFMQQCCMQYLIFMQQCCVQQSTYTVQQSCTQHFNIHDATMLFATLLHGKFNIHDATVACNFVASCMVGFRFNAVTLLANLVFLGPCYMLVLIQVFTVTNYQ